MIRFMFQLAFYIGINVAFPGVPYWGVSALWILSFVPMAWCLRKTDAEREAEAWGDANG